jgi:protein gp37
LIRFFGAESLSIAEAGREDMSAACDHCYAEAFVARGLLGRHDFGTLRLFPERLRDLRKFGPAYEADGLLYPKMVFVNSLSDFWHEKIPDSFKINSRGPSHAGRAHHSNMEHWAFPYFAAIGH